MIWSNQQSWERNILRINPLVIQTPIPIFTMQALEQGIILLKADAPQGFSILGIDVEGVTNSLPYKFWPNSLKFTNSPPIDLNTTGPIAVWITLTNHRGITLAIHLDSFKEYPPPLKNYLKSPTTFVFAFDVANDLLMLHRRYSRPLSKKRSSTSVIQDQTFSGSNWYDVKRAFDYAIVQNDPFKSKNLWQVLLPEKTSLSLFEAASFLLGLDLNDFSEKAICQQNDGLFWNVSSLDVQHRLYLALDSALTVKVGIAAVRFGLFGTLNIKLPLCDMPLLIQNFQNLSLLKAELDLVPRHSNILIKTNGLEVSEESTYHFRFDWPNIPPTSYHQRGTSVQPYAKPRSKKSSRKSQQADEEEEDFLAAQHDQEEDLSTVPSILEPVLPKITRQPQCREARKAAIKRICRFLKERIDKLGKEGDRVRLLAEKLHIPLDAEYTMQLDSEIEEQYLPHSQSCTHSPGSSKIDGSFVGLLKPHFIYARARTEEYSLFAVKPDIWSAVNWFNSHQDSPMFTVNPMKLPKDNSLHLSPVILGVLPRMLLDRAGVLRLPKPDYKIESPSDVQNLVTLVQLETPHIPSVSTETQQPAETERVAVTFKRRRIIAGEEQQQLGTTKKLKIPRKVTPPDQGYPLPPPETPGSFGFPVTHLGSQSPEPTVLNLLETGITDQPVRPPTTEAISEQSVLPPVQKPAVVTVPTQMTAEILSTLSDPLIHPTLDAFHSRAHVTGVAYRGTLNLLTPQFWPSTEPFPPGLTEGILAGVRTVNDMIHYIFAPLGRMKQGPPEWNDATTKVVLSRYLDWVYAYPNQPKLHDQAMRILVTMLCARYYVERRPMTHDWVAKFQHEIDIRYNRVLDQFEDYCMEVRRPIIKQPVVGPALISGTSGPTPKYPPGQATATIPKTQSIQPPKSNVPTEKIKTQTPPKKCYPRESSHHRTPRDSSPPSSTRRSSRERSRKRSTRHESTRRPSRERSPRRSSRDRSSRRERDHRRSRDRSPRSYRREETTTSRTSTTSRGRTSSSRPSSGTVAYLPPNVARDHVRRVIIPPPEQRPKRPKPPSDLKRGIQYFEKKRHMEAQKAERRRQAQSSQQQQPYQQPPPTDYMVQIPMHMHAEFQPPLLQSTQRSVRPRYFEQQPAPTRASQLPSLFQTMPEFQKRVTYQSSFTSTTQITQTDLPPESTSTPVNPPAQLSLAAESDRSAEKSTEEIEQDEADDIQVIDQSGEDQQSE